MHRRGFAIGVGVIATTTPLCVLSTSADVISDRYFGGVQVILRMLDYMRAEQTRVLSTISEGSILDEDWRCDLIAPFTVAAAAQHVLPLLDPPHKWRTIHNDLQSALALYVEGRRDIEAGLVLLNLDLVRGGIDRVNEGTAVLEDVSIAISMAGVES